MQPAPVPRRAIALAAGADHAVEAHAEAVDAVAARLLEVGAGIHRATSARGVTALRQTQTFCCVSTSATPDSPHD
jgi:hypothetical protein